MHRREFLFYDAACCNIFVCNRKSLLFYFRILVFPLLIPFPPCLSSTMCILFFSGLALSGQAETIRLSFFETNNGKASCFKKKLGQWTAPSGPLLAEQWEEDLSKDLRPPEDLRRWPKSVYSTSLEELTVLY